MKPVVKVIVVICAFITLVILTFCYLCFHEPPRYDNKTVLDIRNKTNQLISGMYLSVVVPETYSVPEGGVYYDGKMVIPDIQPHERIIVVLDQKKVALAGMKLQLTYNEYRSFIVDELHTNELYGDIGSMHIININNHADIQSKEIHNYLLQLHEAFYFKHYNRVIKLN